MFELMCDGVVLQNTTYELMCYGVCVLLWCGVVVLCDVGCCCVVCYMIVVVVMLRFVYVV